jgi:hypothetical protein
MSGSTSLAKHPDQWLPDVFVSLDVDLVELGVDRFSGDVRLHLHGDVPRQHRQQKSFL